MVSAPVTRCLTADIGGFAEDGAHSTADTLVTTHATRFCRDRRVGARRSGVPAVPPGCTITSSSTSRQERSSSRRTRRQSRPVEFGRGREYRHDVGPASSHHHPTGHLGHRAASADTKRLKPNQRRPTRGVLTENGGLDIETCPRTAGATRGVGSPAGCLDRPHSPAHACFGPAASTCRPGQSIVDIAAEGPGTATTTRKHNHRLYRSARSRPATTTAPSPYSNSAPWS
jgi:hypothetical protein